ncbi:Uncharacterised protein [Mycobacteroides abscessus subsp. abscessus]|nr:Uncharacterised protein [Mycobacteroides abscessus subsp. abscessus]
MKSAASAAVPVTDEMTIGAPADSAGSGAAAASSPPTGSIAGE